ncbi:killer toxin [Aspergillus novoparasiticus]|uniref:Killer toxin n=1 Tax=Aspergillus novoparasiticus TaxID=986946 RepID=A0A5N6EV01_9EURO|nr:killer toxin [Aspergillus novoparasiticus]
MLAIVFLIVASALTANAKLGINCRGSAKCSVLWGPSDAAQQLTNVIQHIDTNRWYMNGEHIACVGNQAGNGGGYCAFLQKTGGTNGGVIKNLAHYITDHGCKQCGSVPYFFPQGNNNVDDGELTYNYVDDPCATAGTQLC